MTHLSILRVVHSCPLRSGPKGRWFSLKPESALITIPVQNGKKEKKIKQHKNKNGLVTMTTAVEGHNVQHFVLAGAPDANNRVSGEWQLL